MVSIGFVCEGKTEKEIVESSGFQDWLNGHNLRCISPVFNAAGNGNLLPHKLVDTRNDLFRSGANILCILTDLDSDQCITATRQRITKRDDQIVIVAVKQIEAWFLGDTLTLQMMFNDPNFVFDQPEQEQDPFQTLQQLFLTKTSRGVGSKTILVSRMLKYGFTIERAARHPNCPSARYFLTKLQTLASAN